MIRFKTYQSTREGKTKGKWYARAVSDETYGIEELAAHMAQHGSPFSEGTIKGVLNDVADCIKHLALDGKKVKIGDLAIFSLALETRPAATEEEFTPEQNIEAVRLSARATGDFRADQIAKAKELKFLRVGRFAPEEAEAENPAQP